MSSQKGELHHSSESNRMVEIGRRGTFANRCRRWTGTSALVILAGVALAVFASASWAGEIEPPASAQDAAGPVPTMKSLDDIPGSWSRTLPADDGEADGCNSTRFKCIFGGQAVLDSETGLVWKRAASLTLFTHRIAIFHCYNAGVTDRRGWRLPRAHELRSLWSGFSSPKLPPGHPFIDIGNTEFWTYEVIDHSSVYVVNFATGGTALRDPSFERLSWCVRGHEDGENIYINFAYI